MRRAVPALAGLLAAAPAAAERLSALKPGWLAQLQSATGLATAFFTVLGLATVGMGVGYLARHYREARGDAEFQKGLAAVLAGACMVLLPWVVGLVTGTLGVPAEEVVVDFSDGQALPTGDPIDSY